MRTQITVEGVYVTGRCYILDDEKTVKLIAMADRQDKNKPPHVIEVLYYGPPSSLSNLCKGDKLSVKGYVVGNSVTMIPLDADGKPVKHKNKFVHRNVNKLTVCIDVTERGLKTGVPNELRVMSKNPTVTPIEFYSTKHKGLVTFGQMVPVVEPVEKTEEFDLVNELSK